MVLGLIVFELVLVFFPLNNCPKEYQGVLTTCDIPKLYPSLWLYILPFFGWIVTPVIIKSKHNKQNRNLKQTVAFAVMGVVVTWISLQALLLIKFLFDGF
jgi:hypothetical protein